MVSPPPSASLRGDPLDTVVGHGPTLLSGPDATPGATDPPSLHAARGAGRDPVRAAPRCGRRAAPRRLVRADRRSLEGGAHGGRRGGGRGRGARPDPRGDGGGARRVA